MKQDYYDLYQLANVKRVFSENQIAQIAAQLLEQLGEMHKHGLVYRYLRPQSVKFSAESLNVVQNTLKLHLSNIAISQMLDLNQTQVKVLGIECAFLAPEVLLQAMQAGPKADVYSVGVILYALAMGKLQLVSNSSNNSPQTCSYQTSSTFDLDFREPSWSEWSQELRAFIANCIAADLGQRLSVTDLFQTPFMLTFRNDGLSKRHEKSMLVRDSDLNCYLLTIADVLNDIIHRHISFNEVKREVIQKLKLKAFKLQECDEEVSWAPQMEHILQDDAHEQPLSIKNKKLKSCITLTQVGMQDRMPQSRTQTFHSKATITLPKKSK